MSVFTREDAIKLTERFAFLSADILAYATSKGIPAWMLPMLMRFTLLGVELQQSTNIPTNEEFNKQLIDFIEMELSQVQ